MGELGESWLTIWDPKGNCKMETLDRTKMPWLDACIIVYDITDRSSFENLSYWFKPMWDITDRTVPMDRDACMFYIIGNKCDSSGR